MEGGNMMERDQIREGTAVYSADGERLGKVTRLGNESFLIEKGLFFRRDYLVRYENLARIDENGDAYLSVGRDALIEPDEASRYDDATATASTAERGDMARTGDEQRVPLHAEEAVAQKISREAGEVRVRKDVVTEEKQITVPVAREE